MRPKKISEFKRTNSAGKYCIKKITIFAEHFTMYIMSNTSDKILFSIVSPVYKGEEMVSELVSRIEQSVSKITEQFEIILVNDASPDDSWKKIEEECRKNQKVKGINLSRNFGQYYAISAGLSFAKGDWVVVLDCDLQDRPEEIPNLYKKAQEGYDIVYARRQDRKDSFFKRMSSSLFHSIYDFLSGMKTDKQIANFVLMNHSVVAEFNNLREVSRSFTPLLNYLGFRSTFVNVEHSCREEGKSSYTMKKLFKASSDTIISNSNTPLKLAVSIGFIMTIISICFALYNIIARLLGLIQVKGYTTTIFSIWFIGGLILCFLGVVGIYIGRIFDQVKGRPFYIVQEKINIDEDISNKQGERVQAL